MEYLSTRGGMPPKRFCQILLEGLAPDGGLVIPRAYPRLSLAELRQWQRLSYAELAFEAAVAGGIPIIKALREGLTANRIEWIAGIINGTSNVILTEMRDKGRRSPRC